MAQDLLHLLGITAIFIACKYHEVSPLSVILVEKELGHKQFSQREILSMEREILQTIQYHIPTRSLMIEANLKFKGFVETD